MSLRIVREDFYFLLPIDSEHVQSMKGAKDCYVPVSAVCAPKQVMDELDELGSRAAARGLVAEYNDVDSTNEEALGSDDRVIYSVICRLVTKNGVRHVHLSHIEAVDFDLYWGDCGVYQRGFRNEDGMQVPTKRQMNILHDTAWELLESHKIKKADISQINPFLQALVIPKSEGEKRIKAFANDLFHTLGLLLDDGELDVGMSNRYCSFDVNDEHELYYIFFNHPAILGYSEDSFEGRCAYGAWNL